MSFSFQYLFHSFFQPHSPFCVFSISPFLCLWWSPQVFPTSFPISRSGPLISSSPAFIVSPLLISGNVFVKAPWSLSLFLLSFLTFCSHVLFLFLAFFSFLFVVSWVLFIGMKIVHLQQHHLPFSQQDRGHYILRGSKRGHLSEHLPEPSRNTKEDVKLILMLSALQARFLRGSSYNLPSRRILSEWIRSMEVRIGVQYFKLTWIFYSARWSYFCFHIWWRLMPKWMKFEWLAMDRLTGSRKTSCHRFVTDIRKRLVIY